MILSKKMKKIDIPILQISKSLKKKQVNRLKELKAEGMPKT